MLPWLLPIIAAALSVRSFGVFSSNSALERKGGAGNEEMPSRLSVEYSVGSGGEIPRAPPKIPPRIPPQTDQNHGSRIGRKEKRHTHPVKPKPQLNTQMQLYPHPSPHLEHHNTSSCPQVDKSRPAPHAAPRSPTATPHLPTLNFDITVISV